MSERQEGMTDAVNHLYYPGTTPCPCAFCAFRQKLRNDVLEEAYRIARGGDRKFEEHGTRQLYWKGRSDAATEIRKAKTPEK